jgi:hypothetical protein
MLELLIPDAILFGADFVSNLVGGYVVSNTNTNTAPVQKSSKDITMEWELLIEEMNDFKNSLNISKGEKSELVARIIQMVNYASQHNCTIRYKRN